MKKIKKVVSVMLLTFIVASVVAVPVMATTWLRAEGVPILAPDSFCALVPIFQ